MPMYFPDLASVRKCAEMMATHQKPENKYKGIIPKTGEELPEARRQLGKYFREVWKDEIQALEVELAVSEKDYHEKMGQAIQIQFMKKVFSSLSAHEKDNLKFLGIPPFDKEAKND